MKKDKAYILAIETSTEACSVALSENGKTILSEEIDQPKAHASMLAVLIEKILTKAELKASDLAAVAVSEGPGSYTGLRVGVSTAKGICYAAGVPLVSVDTLEILALKAKDHFLENGMAFDEGTRIVPMIDARRMEVYTATFSGNMDKLTETDALILNQDIFSKLLKESTHVIFTGDGAEKSKAVINDPKAVFLPAFPTADFMAEPAFRAYEKSEFEDIAYFEPRYLKEFVAGISKNKLF